MVRHGRPPPADVVIVSTFLPPRPMSIAGSPSLAAAVIRWTLVGWLLVSAESLAAADLSWTPNGAPRWVQSPQVPLAGSVVAATSRPARLTVEVSDGASTWHAPTPPDFALEHDLPVLGLKPGREYTLTATAHADGETLAAAPLQFRTQALPSDFPTLQVVTSELSRMEPGVTLCTVLRWEQNAASLNVGWFIALDAAGEVVWYLRMPVPAGAIRRISNGNFVMLHGAQPTGLREFDPLGRTVRQYRATGTGVRAAAGEIPVDVETFHHALRDLPNGNWLVLTTEVRRFDEYPTGESRPAVKAPAQLVGDVVVELRPEDGAVVGRWKLLDLLDPQRIGYGSLDNFWDLRAYPFVPGGTRDWGHANSLAYDPRDDSFLVCLRHQDAVVKVDRRTSQVQWILGDPAGWKPPLRDRLLRPEGDVVWSYHAHAVEFDADGKLLLFDNGNCRAIPPQKPQPWATSYSRAVEYQVDAAAGTVRQLWSYGGPGKQRFFSAFVGSADWMPQTGNVLICDGGRLESRTGAPLGAPPSAVQWGRVLEVTRDNPADVVFEVRFSEQGRNNEFGSSIYRAERLRSLYP